MCCRYPERAEDSPELELQVTGSHLMWVLGLKSRCSERAVSAPSFCAISQAQYLIFFYLGCVLQMVLFTLFWWMFQKIWIHLLPYEDSESERLTQ